jgi:hypothetical protein
LVEQLGEGAEGLTVAAEAALKFIPDHQNWPLKERPEGGQDALLVSAFFKRVCYAAQTYESKLLCQIQQEVIELCRASLRHLHR